MSQVERHGDRDLTYSAWHRTKSIERFVGKMEARALSMIDLDGVLWVEYEDESRQPVALIEVAADVGQRIKIATVTRNLAIMAGVPAYVLLYTKATGFNPADPHFHDISSFRVRRLAPNEESIWRTMTPEEWASELLRLRKADWRVPAARLL